LIDFEWSIMEPLRPNKPRGVPRVDCSRWARLGVWDRIERFFSQLMHYRAIATRYEKHDANFLALAKLAATRIRLRVHEPVS